MGSGVIGIVAVIFGIALFALAILMLRTVPRVQPITESPVTPPVPPGVTSTADAVLLVQAGGRVLYTNQEAREWFGLLEEDPNLERLARRARPSEVFLGLCATEGTGRFSLNGVFVEGSSFFVPYDGSSAILVTLHRPQVSTLGTGEGASGEISAQALSIFAELSQAMAASLDITTTLKAVLESVERLIPSDYAEICTWDPENEHLIPYRFVGLPGVDRRLEKSNLRYKSNEGYAGFLITRHTPLLIGNVDTYRAVRPAIDRKQYPFNSYMGIPLLLAGEVVGTLELSSLSKNAFTENDLEILNVLSGQAAVAVHNALLYENEQSRVLELSGLAQLAHAVGSLSEPVDLFSRLVDSIKPLVGASIIGFWIYDDNQHTLEAQLPFQGIPPQFIESYRFTVPTSARADEIMKKQEVVSTTEAPNDADMESLGLNNWCQATGIRTTILQPLTVGGKLLGYLQVANKHDDLPFDQNDRRLLAIVAGQAAIIIENATLILQSQKRAQRAEALRRIASLTGSAATVDEILQFSLKELARLLLADIGLILLLEESRGDLRIHRESLFGVEDETLTKIGRYSIEVSKSRLEMGDTGPSQRSFVTGNVREDPIIMPAYRGLLDFLGLQSIIYVPLIVRERGVGEIILGSRKGNFFDKGDVTIIDTAAGQLAGAIEQTSLSSQTDETLRRRVDQLTALTRISRELNSSLEIHHLLQRVYDEVVHTTRAQCGSITLFELSDITIDTSHPPKITLHLGDQDNEELSPLEFNVLKQGESLIIRDFQQYKETGKESLFQPPHKDCRSALIVPIAYQQNVAGLIYLHSKHPDRFDKTSLEIAQTLAIQAAIALGNAQRYQEQIERTELLSRRVETLAKLLETSQTLQLDQPLEVSLESISYGIQESTPFNVVMISVYEPQTGQLQRLASAGMTLTQQREARSRSQPWSSVEQLLEPKFRISRAYFIPADKIPAIPSGVHFIYSNLIGSRQAEGSAWHKEDFLVLPLKSADGSPLGVINVDQPRDGLRPDRPTIDTLEIFATQAALVIESFQKLQELRRASDEIQQNLERSHQATEAAQSHLPVLLHKDIEHTIALQRLSGRARRIRAGLDIAALVNRQKDQSSVLLEVGRGMLTRMDFDVVLIAQPTSRGPRLVHVLGTIPSGVNPEAFLGQRNPLRQCLETGETILVSSVNEKPEWKSSPLLLTLEARGFICLPVTQDIGEKDSLVGITKQEEGTLPGLNAVLLAISLRPLPVFTDEDEQLYGLLTRQVATALQNLQLISETNRRLREVDLLLEFSRRLGSLDPVSILDTLLESTFRVVPAAQAGMVALWDADVQALVPKVATGYSNSEEILKIRYKAGEALPGQVFQQGQAVLLDEIDFARQYNLPPEYLLIYRNATQGRLPIATLIVPIGGSYSSSSPPSKEIVGAEGQIYAAPLGVIVLDNFQTPVVFTEDDQALVTSLAQQTALALENARLFQASEQRALQLQSLTTVAATITSSLQTDDLIGSLLDQARTVIPHDTGTLWLRQENRLTIRAARGFADSEERVGLSVAVEDSLLLKEMINTGRPILVNDVRQDTRFPSLIEPQYLSWLGVPLISKGEVVGVIALEKTEASYYTSEHIQAVTTFAGQAAVALENANLYEESVHRAVEMDRRSQRLAVLNRLSTELSGTLDQGHILTMTIQELLSAVSCQAVSALLFTGANEVSVLAESPRTSPDLPLVLPDAPLFGRLRETLGVFNSEDILDNQGKINSPLLDPLADYLSLRSTRALLVLPLVTGTDLHGLLFIHNQQSYRFSSDEVELARTISNQAAFAVQNANLFAETQRLFAETRQNSAELATLFALGVNVSQVLDQQQLVNLAFENILNLLQVNSVMLVIQNENNELIAQTIDHGKRIGLVQLPSTGESLSQHVMNTGQPVLIGDVVRDKEKLPVPGYIVGDPSRSWLGVPLIVRGSAIGSLSIQDDEPDRFGESQLRLLIQIGNQLAVAFDNARLFATVQNYAASLEQRVEERTAQLAREHKRIETLLGIMTELSTSLDMDMVLNRTLGLINGSIGGEHSLIMLVDPDTYKLFLRSSVGYTAPVYNEKQTPSFLPDDGFVKWIILHRQSVLVDDLLEDARWTKRDLGEDQPRSCLAVPLMMGEDTLGSLLIFHRQPSRFSTDQLELIQATAKQIAVAINNSQLFLLIRDQAERLGDMLRTQHIETSRSQAILEAVADGVLVTDANRVITLFNASAESILGMERQQVLGRTLEHFSGLFGKVAQSWMETIRLWSEDPSSSEEAGRAYIEQLVLEDKRVVSVHLAPVILRTDFLGTVSIFQDITHQVEVDRLKSEFVATVSHELRTPMTSIKGYVEILLMGAAGRLTEQQTHFLEIVKANTERLAILVNDLLDISRIEAGRITLSLQSLDMHEIASKAISDMIQRSQDDKKAMDFQVDMPPEIVPVNGDPDRVRQILDNLLENAYYYTPEHGKILLKLQQVDDDIRVDVIDNGIGILASDKERIFERFYRGEDPLVLSTSGTGLGLSIVQRLLDMHNGRIWVESSGVPGEGSTFSFTLPVYREPDSEVV